MIRVEIQSNTAIRGVPAYAGDILEIDETDYKVLASYQLAKPYVEPEVKLEEKKEVIVKNERKYKKRR